MRIASLCAEKMQRASGAASCPPSAGTEPWALDFFSHLDRVRDYSSRHDIDFREASQRFIAIPAPKPKSSKLFLLDFRTKRLACAPARC